MINEIILAIEKLKIINGKCTVALDGRCGAGKTTLSEKLAEIYNCNVFHMDDFYLPFEKRTAERLSCVGGHIDHERFFEEVLTPISKKNNFSYRIFDCKTNEFEEPTFVTNTEVTIVEGSYSCHSTLWDSYDLHVFVDVDSKNQEKRLMLREGEEKFKIFREKWIQLEERYFSETQIKYKCEIYYITSM